MRDIAPELDHENVRLITTYAIAGADGLFIAKEIGGDSVDLIKLFDLHARLVFDAAVKLLQPETSMTPIARWQTPPTALRRPEQRVPIHPDRTYPNLDVAQAYSVQRLNLAGTLTGAVLRVTRSG